MSFVILDELAFCRLVYIVLSVACLVVGVLTTYGLGGRLVHSHRFAQEPAASWRFFQPFRHALVASAAIQESLPCSKMTASFPELWACRPNQEPVVCHAVLQEEQSLIGNLPCLSYQQQTCSGPLQGWRRLCRDAGAGLAALQRRPCQSLLAHYTGV